VISIREIASVLNPARKGRRFLAIYRFFCDESYDSDPNAANTITAATAGPHIPASYVVAGFFAEEAVWAEIEQRWSEENRRAGVTRYHATYVNSRTGEFEGWGKDQQDAYSKNLLKILRDQNKKLYAIACGLLARDYEEVISAEGREKFGAPYVVCFKTVIGMIAQELEIRNFEPDDKFAVVFDHGDHDVETVDAFLRMKYHPDYRFGHRLASCTPGDWKEYIQLQAADLIAYETFKMLHGFNKTGTLKARKSLESMFQDNGFMSYYLDRETLAGC